MITRRKFMGVLGPAAVTGSVCVQMPKARPTKLEPGQVWRHKSGVKFLCGKPMYFIEPDGWWEGVSIWPDGCVHYGAAALESAILTGEYLGRIDEIGGGR